MKAVALQADGSEVAGEVHETKKVAPTDAKPRAITWGERIGQDAF